MVEGIVLLVAGVLGFVDARLAWAAIGLLGLLKIVGQV